MLLIIRLHLVMDVLMLLVIRLHLVNGCLDANHHQATPSEWMS